jgi:hypothetical protein
MKRATFPLELSFKEIKTASDIVRRVAEMQVAEGELSLPSEDEQIAAKEAASHASATEPAKSTFSFSTSKAAETKAPTGPALGTEPMILLGLPEPRRKRYDAVRLDNNELTTLEGVKEALERVVEDLSEVKWLDLSFNSLGPGTAEKIAAMGVPRLQKLYLHGNNIEHLSEMDALAAEFSSLKSLTMHGTPVREQATYRQYAVSTIPTLVKLDLTPVTPAERDSASSWRAMTKMRVRRVPSPTKSH